MLRHYKLQLQLAEMIFEILRSAHNDRGDRIIQEATRHSQIKKLRFSFASALGFHYIFII